MPWSSRHHWENNACIAIFASIWNTCIVRTSWYIDLQHFEESEVLCITLPKCFSLHKISTFIIPVLKSILCLRILNVQGHVSFLWGRVQSHRESLLLSAVGNVSWPPAGDWKYLLQNQSHHLFHIFYSANLFSLWEKEHEQFKGKRKKKDGLIITAAGSVVKKNEVESPKNPHCILNVWNIFLFLEQACF